MRPADRLKPSLWESNVYAQGRQINRWPHTEVISRVVRATAGQDPATLRVLELGCGTGNNLRFLAEEGFLTHGIEASPTAVQLALDLLERSGLQSDLKMGDMASLPWADNHFDVLVDRAALVHNSRERILEILDAARRVLKPGGRLISIGLKSVRHPDLSFGERTSDSTWSNFKQGKFRGLGATSFFREAEIAGLFQHFEIECLETITRTGPAQEILDEEFVVEAVRP